MFKKITFIFPVLILVLFLSFLSLSNTLASSIDGYWEDNFDHGTSSIDTNRSKNIKLNPEKEQIEIYDYSGIATTVYENDFDYEGIILYENNFDYEGNPIPLPNGLANGDFENGDLDNWTTGGSNNIGWLATNEDKYNGSWSARSGDITWSNSSFIERDFTIANNQVPATLTFYWKSKGTDNDTLKLYDNGILQKKIEGNTHWTFVSYSIPDDNNDHTIEWKCYKGSNNITETKGFIDDVKLKEGPFSNEPPGIVWKTGGSNGVGWSVTDEEKYDGLWSMQSGDITWSNSSFIERDFVGPGTLTFYWKSKGTDNDTLKLYDNGGTEVKTIEGDTDWKFVSHSINDNLNHTIKWKCYKGSNNITETKGFIDDVKFKEGPFSNEPPGSAWETGGSNGIGWSVTDEEKYGGLWSMQSGDITWSNSSFIKRDFTIANNEVPAILTFWWKSKGTDNDTLKLYDNGGTAVKTIKGDTGWKFVSYSIPDDNNDHTIEWKCYKGSNNVTKTKGFIDNIKLIQKKSPFFDTYRTGGSNGVGWSVTDEEKYDGSQSMQSGDITWSNSSFVERDFVGPGTLTFWWKSKGTDNDTLKLYDNGGTAVKTIKGDTDWKFVSHSINDNLNHTIKWKCYKGSNNITETKGFIDDVKFYLQGLPGWETGGSNGIGWSVTDEEKYDGLWSMQSGDITWSNSSFIKRDFTIANNQVPATLTFYWKSKGTDNDTLKLYDNGGTEVKTIKGDTDWKFVSYSIPGDNNDHTIEWKCYKGSNNTTETKGFIDDVKLKGPGATAWKTGGSNGIGWSVTDEEKYDGLWSMQSGDITWSNSSFIERDFTIANNQVPATLTFYWKSKGTDNDTLKLYDNGILQKKIEGNTHWTFVSYSIPDDSNNHTIKWECDKGSNNTTETKGFIDDVKLKGPGLINWQTGESNGVNWNININEHNAGFYSMQSGDITWSNSSFIERDFVGPGTLTFYWKSKGTDNDTLKLYDNGGTEVKTIEGDTDWKFVSHSINDNLNHTIKWKCDKGSNNITETKGFIDDVNFNTQEQGFENLAHETKYLTGFEKTYEYFLLDEDFEDEVTAKNLEWHEGFEFNDSAEGWLYSEFIRIEQLYEWTEFISDFVKPDPKTTITYEILDHNDNDKVLITFEAGDNFLEPPKIEDITSIDFSKNSIVLRAHLITKAYDKTPAIKNWGINYKIDSNPPDLLTIKLQTKAYPYTAANFTDNPLKVYKSDIIRVKSTAGDESGIESHKIDWEIKTPSGVWENPVGSYVEWTYATETHTDETSIVAATNSIEPFFNPSDLETGTLVRYWAEAKDFQGNHLAINSSIFEILNHPPIAKMSCEVVTCGKYPDHSEMPGCECDPNDFSHTWETYIGDHHVNFQVHNKSEELDGPDDTLTRIWSIVNPWPKSTCNVVAPSTICSGDKITIQNITAGVYNVKLKVTDEDLEADTITHAIKVKQDIDVDFKCSLIDPSDPLFAGWKKCEDIKAGVSDRVYIKDISKPSEGAGVSIISRDWSIAQATPPTVPPWVIYDRVGNNDPLVSIVMNDSTHTVELIVRDSIGREGSILHTINVGELLPKYREVPPFTSFKEINIANISSFLKNVFR